MDLSAVHPPHHRSLQRFCNLTRAFVVFAGTLGLLNSRRDWHWLSGSSGVNIRRLGIGRSPPPPPSHSKKEDCVVSHHSSASAVDAIRRALRDASTSKHTRRWFLERTALGAVGIAVPGAVVRAGNARADAQHEPNPPDSVEEWGGFASTTEALTVTILTELVRRAGVNRVSKLGVRDLRRRIRSRA